MRQLKVLGQQMLFGEGFINPSVCKDYLCYRHLNIVSQIWISKIILYCRNRCDKKTIIECNDYKSKVSAGIEDVRVFDYKGEVWFVGCARGENERFKTLIGKISENSIIVTNTLDNPEYNVKNVVPLIADQMFFLDVLKGTVYDKDLSKYAVLNIDTSQYSGSTQFVRLNDQLYGGVVHVVMFQPMMIRHPKFRYKNRSIYIHFWMELDIKNWIVTFVSEPFYVHHYGVEFVSGIEKLDDNRICLYYGVDDNRSYKCEVHLNELRNINSCDWKTCINNTWEDIQKNGPCYIINLDRKPERYDVSLRRIKEAGFVNVSRHRAIDAGCQETDLKQEWARHGNPKLAKNKNFTTLHKGEQGCFLSHINVWIDVINNNIPYAIIFEDDILFHKDWTSLSKYYFDITPKNWDILFMGAQIEGCPDSLIVQKPVYCLHAYIITLEGAKRLYKYLLKKEVYSIDTMMKDDMCKNEFPLTWYAWNGMHYPDENRGTNPHWKIRNTGLVFQDENQGSDINQH